MFEGGENFSFIDKGSSLPGYVAINLRRPNKVQLIYAPDNVKTAVKDIIRELAGKKPKSQTKCKSGVKQYVVTGEKPFKIKSKEGSSSDALILGKLLVLRLLERMHALGFDFVTASDLSRMSDQSTMFFKKVDGPTRVGRKIACIAPGSSNRLILLNHDVRIQDCLTKTILSTWSQGIESSEDKQTFHEIRFKGNPWLSDIDIGESNEARLLLGNIITGMSRIGWRFHGNVNIAGDTDSMFFIQSPHQPLVTSMISLNNADRIRMIGGSYSQDRRIVDSVRKCIRDTWQPDHELYEQNNHGGVHEFKLNGTPFLTSKMDAVGTRRLICKIFETLRPFGWAPLTGNDLSKNDKDSKSAITMIRCQPGHALYACLSLSSIDKIRLIGFPGSMVLRMQALLSGYWRYGSSGEGMKAHDCYEFKLTGRPWEQGKNWGLHARAVLVHILKHFQEEGWQVMASLDVSSKIKHQNYDPDYPVDVHSWYFSKPCQPGQVPTISLDDQCELKNNVSLAILYNIVAHDPSITVVEY